MFKRKTIWEEVSDFNPADAGFIYDENCSHLELVEKLIHSFHENCPKIKDVDFIGAILVDGISFWQIAEEMKRMSLVGECELLTEMTLFGYPVLLTSIEGIALGLKVGIAPVVVRQQIAFYREWLKQEEKFAETITKSGQMAREYVRTVRVGDEKK